MRASQADQLDTALTAAVAVLACGAAAAGAPTPVMAVLGVALFAMPGYLLAQLLLGSGSTAVERVLVAVGLSLATPALGGLALYAAGVALHRAAWTGLLAGVTLACDVALFLRRRAGRAAPPRWSFLKWRPAPRHAVAFAAAAVLAACGLGLASVGAAVQPHQGFTQLGLSTRNVKPNTVRIGVTNNEGHTTGYRLVLLRNGRVKNSWNLTLANGRSWQRTVPLTTRLAADLYRLPDLTVPYRHVDVNGDKALGP